MKTSFRPMLAMLCILAAAAAATQAADANEALPAALAFKSLAAFAAWAGGPLSLGLHRFQAPAWTWLFWGLGFSLLFLPLRGRVLCAMILMSLPVLFGGGSLQT